MHVPIVENNRTRADFFREVLAGHCLRIERSGTGALEALREQAYDLVFLGGYDLTSPRVPGYDVAEAVADTPNAQTPVLVHSMNIGEARRIPPLLPVCWMCSFAELRERHAEGELLATVEELTDRESLGR
jgi:CheY-like chemotaxis protein